MMKCYYIFSEAKRIKRAVSSAVERLPYKQVVTGSNPVPPNVFIQKMLYIYNSNKGSSSKGSGQGPSKSLM